jgi:hypothetical protein
VDDDPHTDGYSDEYEENDAPFTIVLSQIEMPVHMPLANDQSINEHDQN